MPSTREIDILHAEDPMDLALPSITDVPPPERGGPIARTGFDFQDHVTAQACIAMITPGSRTSGVLCESHDDFAVVEDGVVEFVQVKGEQLTRLWTTPKLCEREGSTKAKAATDDASDDVASNGSPGPVAGHSPPGKSKAKKGATKDGDDEGKKGGRVGTSIVERSLSHDVPCREDCRFRIVTSRPVNPQKNLALLLLPLSDTSARNLKAAEFEALATEITERLPGVQLSPRGRDVSFWVSRTHWVVHESAMTVRNSNLHALDELSHRLGLRLTIQARERSYMDLLAKVAIAARADWNLDRTAKVISRAQLEEWFKGFCRENHRPLEPAQLWNVPFQRNLLFTGRSNLLARLEALLSTEGAGALVSLGGLGGVGKTQLALAFIYKYRERYDVVWWVRAEAPGDLGNDLSALAVKLALPGASDPAKAVNAAREWLEQHGKWLLVFDNAPSEDAIDGFLPRGPGGHVLITSRRQDWGDGIATVVVDVLSREESIEFLVKRTGLADDAEGAGKLSDELGRLPLALAQAGSFMARHRLGFAPFLDLFRARRQDVIAQLRGTRDYDTTLATTWNVSFEGVRAESPAAAMLLELCAFLDPDAIPVQLLARDESVTLPDALRDVVRDELRLRRTLAVLSDYSLITLTEDSLSVHRLVQAATRDSLDESRRSLVATMAVELVNASVPKFDDPAAWTSGLRLLPHVVAVSDHARHLGIRTRPLARVLIQAGYMLSQRGDILGAKAVEEQALALSEELHGDQHDDTMTARNNLAQILFDLGERERAQDLQRGAVACAVKVHGPDSEHVGTCLNGLGRILAKSGKLAEARKAHDDAMAIFKRASGRGAELGVAWTYHNLGDLEHAAGDFNAALGHFRTALDQRTTLHGRDHEDTVRSLAGVSLARKQLEGGVAVLADFERVVECTRANKGPDHPEFAQALNLLGLALLDAGRATEALPALRESLKVTDSRYGANSAMSADLLKHIAEALRQTGDHVSAGEHFRRAVEACERMHGRHERTASALNGLGTFLLHLGRPEDALSHLERAAEIAGTACEDAALHAVVLWNLGACCAELADYSRAEASLVRALPIAQRCFGPDHANARGIQRELSLIRSAREAH